MAKFTFKSGEAFIEKLNMLGAHSDAVIKQALHEGAHILTNEIRANLEKNLEGSKESTGSLERSLGITPITQDKNGVWNVKIGFEKEAYDEKGVPNLLKARVMESGTSRIKKRPFVRPAVNAKRKEVEAAMERVIMEEIKRTMEK